MKQGSSKMPQNHRPGSTFGTPNKPSAGGAPLPMNHGYSKGVFQSGKAGNKFASGGKKPPGTC